MNRARRIGASVAVLVATLSTAVLSPASSGAVTRGRVAAAQVSVRVVSVSPSTPAITATDRPLVITVALENTTSQVLTGVSLVAERGDPIGSQTALTASLASSSARTGGLVVKPVTSTTVTLSPQVPVTTTFRTTTSLRNDTGRLCLCINEIYPIDLTARSAQNTVLGGARTYLPSFDEQPTAKLGVTWIWPLIDRPHRTADGSVFTDDALASSVAGGRLDRALQVVEGVAQAQVPITLLVDPDLLDELQTMARGSYTVRANGAAATPGTGQQAAIAWLTRLRAVVAAPSQVDIEFTPLGDPDVTGLSGHGRGWSSTLSSTVTTSVTDALGGIAPQHTLAMPPTGTATTAVLDKLVAAGSDTVVLNGARVRPSTADGIPVSSTRIRTSKGSVAALLTSPALQTAAQSALAGTSGALPRLVAQLAVRVDQRPNVEQTATIAAPRYADPSPSVAVPVILSTVRSVFSAPVSADAALEGAVAPTSTSTLRSPVTSADGLTDGQLDRIAAVHDLAPSVTALIGGSTAGRQILSVVPDTLQRAESAAWSQAGGVIGGGPSPGTVRIAALDSQLRGYLKRVRILPPSSGNYTLASSDSPLPISVRNENALSVRVRLTVKPVGGLPGFTAGPASTVEIGADNKATFKVPAHVERSGRIPVQAELSTPDGTYLLGEPVMLFVHSTVLGTIGVVITIVAGVVLVLALLIRYVRRVLRIRSKRDPAAAT